MQISNPIGKAEVAAVTSQPQATLQLPAVLSSPGEAGNFAPALDQLLLAWVESAAFVCSRWGLLRTQHCAAGKSPKDSESGRTG